jgi:hypothetical protein
LPVDEQQFCYNAQGIQKDINRLLDLGANTNRICQKIQKINPDFCTTKPSTRRVEERFHSDNSISSTSLQNLSQAQFEQEGVPQKPVYPRRRGVIYE